MGSSNPRTRSLSDGHGLWGQYSWQAWLCSWLALGPVGVLRGLAGAARQQENTAGVVLRIYPGGQTKSIPPEPGRKPP